MSTPTLPSVGKNRMPPVQKPVTYYFLIFWSGHLWLHPFARKALACHLLFAPFHRVDPVDFSISRMIFLPKSTDHESNCESLSHNPEDIVSRYSLSLEESIFWHHLMEFYAMFFLDLFILLSINHWYSTKCHNDLFTFFQLVYINYLDS